MKLLQVPDVQGGLTNRQAEAMFWTEWFCSVCEGHITYADERA